MSRTKSTSNLPVEPEGTKKKNTKVALATANKYPRARHLLKRFGITEEQYAELLRRQEGNCAVCKRHYSKFKQRLCVDHDHLTGEIRGLLCTYCNRRIVGRHRSSNGALLLKQAYDYLIAEYIGWVVPPKIKKKKRRKKR